MYLTLLHITVPALGRASKRAGKALQRLGTKTPSQNKMKGRSLTRVDQINFLHYSSSFIDSQAVFVKDVTFILTISKCINGTPLFAQLYCKHLFHIWQKKADSALMALSF